MAAPSWRCVLARVCIAQTFARTCTQSECDLDLDRERLSRRAPVGSLRAASLLGVDSTGTPARRQRRGAVALTGKSICEYCYSKLAVLVR